MAKRKTKRPRGRPSIYSAKLAGDICARLEAGYFIDTASHLSGINPDTFYEWVKTRPEFSELVKKALAVAEKDLIGELKRRGPGKWQAIAWLLERRFKSKYFLKHQHEITGKDGGDIKVTFGKGIDFKGKKD